MKAVYRVLAYIIAIEVVIQSMSMVFAVAGLGKYIDDGGVANKTLFEEGAESPFPEVLGFAIHGINGMMIIPLLALIFLIVSFFTKLPGAATWAAVVVGLVALQIVLGIAGHSIPALGALHGLVAFVLLGAALNAARRTRVGESRSVDDDASLATSN